MSISCNLGTIKLLRFFSEFIFLLLHNTTEYKGQLRTKDQEFRQLSLQHHHTHPKIFLYVLLLEAHRRLANSIKPMYIKIALLALNMKEVIEAHYTMLPLMEIVQTHFTETSRFNLPVSFLIVQSKYNLPFLYVFW